jgi:choline dehydrogenase-like flavoprotein
VYCQLCGSFGCETGAKSSTLETLIPKAEATGRCQVLEQTRATEITLDEQGRAKGVVYRGQDGVEHELRARVVIVACSAIESARLLLMSRSARFPEGLANDTGQVGRHLVFSTLAKAHGSFRYETDPTRAEVLRDPAPFVGRSILDYYAPKNAAVRKAGALNFLFPSGGPIAQAEQVASRDGKLAWGPELYTRMREFFHEQRQVDCETFGEYLPTAGTRIELDEQVRDAAGFPVARIRIDRHPHDFEVARYLAGRAAEVLGAAGAERVWESDVGGRTMHLPMGCLRMGADPHTSVVDAACRAHSVTNLYVSDGSVLASSGGVPPTLTILANAYRVGEGIGTRLARGEL